MLWIWIQTTNQSRGPITLNLSSPDKMMHQICPKGDLPENLRERQGLVSTLQDFQLWQKRFILRHHHPSHVGTLVEEEEGIEEGEECEQVCLARKLHQPELRLLVDEEGDPHWGLIHAMSENISAVCSTINGKLRGM
mmetsp:Transcript_22248/g.73214  ORF Transcript_22248/g.73214 Transcript_22248/m.73214 type:complete len:137 (-) Transcript_22248:1546-1956(-)